VFKGVDIADDHWIYCCGHLLMVSSFVFEQSGYRQQTDCAESILISPIASSFHISTNLLVNIYVIIQRLTLAYIAP